MKKQLLFLALALASVAQAQKPFKMDGIIEGASDVKEVTIQLTNESDLTKMDPAETVAVKKGKFSYTKQIGSIIQAVVTYGEGEGAHKSTVFFVPGEKLKLTLKGDEYFYGGSQIYKECNDADMALTPKYQDYVKYYQSAVARLRQVPEAEQEAFAQKLNDTLRLKSQAYQDALQQYADSHQNVEGAMLYLANYQGTEAPYEKMSAEMKEGRVGKYYKGMNEYMAKLRAEQEKKAAEAQAKLDEMSGAPAKDFTLNDLNGNPLALSSLRGKYVVLDFWGSWCGWCIKGIPDMKKYYEKYAGKFEILGVDCNDTEDAWKQAVEKYELPWKHVYNPRTSSVLSDYAVTGFPTKIVIDPEGKIAKIIVGEDPAFYTYLDEILGK